MSSHRAGRPPLNEARAAGSEPKPRSPFDLGVFAFGREEEHGMELIQQSCGRQPLTTILAYAKAHAIERIATGWKV